MKKYRPVIAAAMALLFYTIADILIWQRISSRLTKWFNMLPSIILAGLFLWQAYAIMGVILMWDAWKDCLYFLTSLFVGAFSGLEDILYYLLDGKPMPHTLPWLEGNPMIYHVSRVGVIGSVSFWMMALAILYILLYHWQTPIAAKITQLVMPQRKTL